MKLPKFSMFVHPLYVFTAGVIGGGIVAYLFLWNYPLPADKGLAFVNAPEYLVWVFLLIVLSCLNTIFLLPSVGMFAWLYKKHVLPLGIWRQLAEIAKLLLAAVLLVAIVGVLLRFLNSPSLGVDVQYPTGFSLRIAFVKEYTFLAFLPVVLGLLLIYSAARQYAGRIQSEEKTEKELFPEIQELIFHRNMLQNYLLIAGIMLSMVTLATAGQRAILVAVKSSNDLVFPVSLVMIYGLIFTLLLLLIYVPTHLALAEASQKLRDDLCPLDSLDTLKEDLERRGELDELLQTNTDIIQNLKTGIVLLSPLVTGLVTSLLGPAINP